MAAEIQYRHDQTGETLYGILMDPTDGTHWDFTNSAWDAMVVADWGDYDIPMTETPVSSYKYVADMPAVAANIVVELQIYRRLGGSPAITDPILAKRASYWNDTASELQDVQVEERWTVEGDEWSVS